MRRALVLLVALCACDAPVIDVHGVHRGSGGYRSVRAPLPETEHEWLAVAHRHVANHDYGAAIRSLDWALETFPDSRVLQKLRAHLTEARAFKRAMQERNE